MTISPPVGVITQIVKFVYTWATQKLFLATYRQSHIAWVRRHGLGANWKPLGEHIEYSLRLAQLTDPEPRKSKIAFRAKDQQVDRMSLVFMAKGSAGYHQQEITLFDIGSTPVIFILDQIPYQDLVCASESQGIYFSIENYQFRRCEIVKDRVQIKVPDSLTAHLTHNWLLNDEHVRRWGHWWNCNLIKWAKHEIRGYWKYGFGTGTQQMRFYSLYTPGMLPVRLLTAFMSSRWMVSLQFWGAIWSSLYRLSDEGKLVRHSRKADMA
ncbi:hypothetical protein [Serratia fonticola]|uniref:hypothetical protein n=1 Tax=Serratia fonticola TaxID=47917 RepID=UPI00192B8082|nr:hypothetical protein [Serratia fonticola]MBL5827574.1 hypothetical protein [Serratia fonticola]MBL5864328.1 hypothetical protein [Serratia fonticola]